MTAINPKVLQSFYMRRAQRCTLKLRWETDINEIASLKHRRNLALVYYNFIGYEKANI